MSFSGFSFVFWRIFQILTLIPIVGMLSWFVDYFKDLNRLTPDEILVLFIVSVIAVVWAIGTLFLYARAKHSAGFVAFVDLLIFGALIGAVVVLRHIGKANCTSFERTRWAVNWGSFSASGNGGRLNIDRSCAMLKASWALAIMNIVFFALTFWFATRVHSHHKDERVVVKRESTHVSRHSHRSRSPRRSHHSSRRSYHV